MNGPCDGALILGNVFSDDVPHFLRCTSASHCFGRGLTTDKEHSVWRSQVQSRSETRTGLKLVRVSTPVGIRVSTPVGIRNGTRHQ